MTGGLPIAADDSSDAALAARAADGNGAAFAVLIERHYDFVYRIAYRWLGRKADAEDVAQTVCLRLAGAIRSFRGGSAFSSWLYAITLNATRDWARRSARESVRREAYAIEAPRSAPAHAAAEEEEAAERLWAAVRGLPDKQREAVTLVYGEGLSHARAADLMGCAENTVSWHVHEAKKRLKQAMRHADEEA